jgi:hypothetical protein
MRDWPRKAKRKKLAEREPLKSQLAAARDYAIAMDMVNHERKWIPRL